MADYWQDRADTATERLERLRSFGPRARGILVTTCNGLFVVDPEDSGVGSTLLHHGEYGAEEIRAVSTVLRKESKVLVVGAHIGALVVPLSRICSKLVAIEANPRTFELLQANVRMADVRNVELHNVAVGDIEFGRIEFLLNRDNSGGSKRRPASSEDQYRYDNPEIISLPTRRLDDLVSDEMFDAIVMDIEGSEIHALRGMPRLLSGSAVLAVEFRTHHIIDVAGATVEEFIPLVLPNFNCLYVPHVGAFEGQEKIAEKLRAMFAGNECHDVIYFSKEPLPSGFAQD